MFAPDAQDVLGMSSIVSLKAFAVELKNNCPSVVFENTAGAVNSSVSVDIDGDDPGTPPPKAKLATVVPAEPTEVLAVDKSATSVHDVPFQISVIPVRGGTFPATAIAEVLSAPEPATPSLFVFISLTSVQEEPSQDSVAIRVVGGEGGIFPP
jgi:hypothetical protein